MNDFDLGPIGNEPQHKVRVSVNTFRELAASFNEGVSAAGQVYNGIAIGYENSTRDNRADLYVRGGDSGSAGISAIIKIASGIAPSSVGVRNPGEYIMLLVTSGMQLLSDEVVIIDSQKITDDDTLAVISEFKKSLSAIRSSVKNMMDWNSISKSEFSQLIRDLVESSVGNPEDVATVTKERIGSIMNTCFGVIKESEKTEAVKTIIRNGQFSTMVTVLLSTIAADYVARLVPGYLPGVNESVVRRIKTQIVQKTKNDLSRELTSLIISGVKDSISSDSSVLGEVSNTVYMIVGSSMRRWINELEVYALSLAGEFGAKSSEISDIVDGILQSYITKIDDIIGQSAKVSWMSQNILLAEDKMSLSSASDTVSSLIGVLAAMNTAMSSVDVSADDIGIGYIESMWTLLISGHSQPTVSDNIVPFVAEDNDKNFLAGLDRPEYDADEQHKNFTELMRAASSELMASRRFREAVSLVRYAQEASAEQQYSDIQRVMDLSVAMGAMYSRLDSANYESDNASKNNQDPSSASNVSIIVSGEVQDKYKYLGYEKISIPISKYIPTMRNHLRLIKGIDEVVVMYTIGPKFARDMNESVSSTYINEGIGQQRREGFVVARKFNNMNDIPDFLKEHSMQMFGAAISGTRTGADISKVLLSDSGIQLKLAVLNKWLQEVLKDGGAKDGLMTAIQHWSGDMLEQKTSSIMKLLSRDSHGAFLSACKLYRAASMYENMSKLAESSIEAKRTAAYYEAGRALSGMIKSGDLKSCSRLLTASVRSDKFSRCPFGLSIPDGCRNASDFIDKMQPIMPNDSQNVSEDKSKANTLFLNRVKKDENKCGKCKYARSFMKAGKDYYSVVCNYGEANAGVDSIDLSEGVGASYPTSMWAGLFSIPSSMGPEARDSYMARSPGYAPFGGAFQSITPGL